LCVVAAVLALPAVAWPQGKEPKSSAERPLERQRETVGHLLDAASHLEAVGRTEQAKSLRLEAARTEKQAVLAEKLERLAVLRADVDQLQRELNIGQQVLLRLRVMEISLQKMRESGFDIAALYKHSGKDAQTNIKDDKKDGDAATDKGKVLHIGAAESMEQMIEALRADGLIKVLAEPTLITVSGRPASFHAGGEFPIAVPQSNGGVAVEFRQFGTHVDCVAVVLGDGTLRVELRPSVTEIDTSHTVRADEVDIPALRTRMFELAAEMKAGQMLLVGGPMRGGATGEATSLLVSVRPEFADPILSASSARSQRR